MTSVILLCDSTCDYKLYVNLKLIGSILCTLLKALLKLAHEQTLGHEFTFPRTCSYSSTSYIVILITLTFLPTKLRPHEQWKIWLPTNIEPHEWKWFYSIPVFIIIYTYGVYINQANNKEVLVQQHRWFDCGLKRRCLCRVYIHKWQSMANESW